VAEFAEIKPTKYIDPQGFQQIFRLFSNCEQLIDRLFHLPDRIRLSEITDLKPLMAFFPCISSFSGKHPERMGCWYRLTCRSE
jgi:hypothetical protein